MQLRSGVLPPVFFERGGITVTQGEQSITFRPRDDITTDYLWDLNETDLTVAELEDFVENFSTTEAAELCFFLDPLPDSIFVRERADHEDLESYEENIIEDLEMPLISQVIDDFEEKRPFIWKQDKGLTRVYLGEQQLHHVYLEGKKYTAEVVEDE